MAFCRNCGEQVSDDAKFCAVCGMPVEYTEQNTRKTTYEGVLYKCPQCGEVMKSFTAICPSCGYELRGASVSKAVQEFYEKLESAKTDELRVLLIQSYPIPNTKEDILEFMILAASNINSQLSPNLLEAWRAKFEQSYQKAELLFGSESQFNEIKELYKSICIKTNSARASQVAQQVGNIAKNFWNTMPNPVFGIVAVLLISFEVTRLFTGWFDNSDIIFSALILYVTYKITEKEKRKKGKTSSASKASKSCSKDPTEIPKIKIPAVVRSGSVENYASAEMLLERAGFVNVKTIPLNDLTMGILSKPGEIASITIDGKELSSYFRRRFDSNAVVVISYHSMR